MYIYIVCVVIHSFKHNNSSIFTKRRFMTEIFLFFFLLKQKKMLAKVSFSPNCDIKYVEYIHRFYHSLVKENGGMKM